MKQAGIYVNDVFCGVLTEDEEGYHFCYEKDYLASQGASPISPTMPLTEQQYDKEMMFPVFDGQFRHALQELFPDRHWEWRVCPVTSL